MAYRLVLPAILAMTFAGAVQAAPACNCVPTTHQVRVPDTIIQAPQLVVSVPSSNNSGVSGAGGLAYSDAFASSGVDAATSSQAAVTTSVSVTGSLNSTSTSTAKVYGGGGGFFVDNGPSTSIPTLGVDLSPVESRKVCAEYASAIKDVRIEAACLDDKGAPHPASQTSPVKVLPDRFDGEIYRCIAGTRLQYTLVETRGEAGRTFTCEKGQALILNATGQVQCRAQIPARDCNERSLLRRYGPGAKTARLSSRGVCIAWKDDTRPSNPAPGAELVLNGSLNP